MRVLMLGGTGAMGIHLAKFLAEAGKEVYVTSRTLRHSENKINYLQGDAQNDSFLEGILKKEWDVIIDFMVYSTKSFESRLNKLLQATGQYVYLSSARVYANTESYITEESPRLLDVTTDKEFISTDEYALSKARQENMLFNSKKTNWTIIRPYITYSEERLQLGVLEKEAWLYRALHNRPILFSSDIYPKVSTLTYGLDVAKSISAIIGEKGALGQAFHITNPNSIAWKDVLAIYINVLSEHLGSQPEVLLRLFFWLLKAGVRLLFQQALRTHESTDARHLSDYVLSERLKPENGGSQSKLSATQTTHLIEHLTEKTYSHTHQIFAYVEETFGLKYTVSGMNKWLHHNGLATSN